MKNMDTNCTIDKNAVYSLQEVEAIGKAMKIKSLENYRNLYYQPDKKQKLKVQSSSYPWNLKRKKYFVLGSDLIEYIKNYG